MSKDISPGDLEHLSAYIDGALAPHELQRLERRLTEETDLAQTLHNLQTTHAQLRAAPQRRVPRNFTLSPAMAGVKEKNHAPWYSGYGLVSATASLMLVLTLVGQFLAAQPLGATASLAAQEAPPALVAPQAATKEGSTPEAGLAAPQENEEIQMFSEATGGADRAGQPSSTFDLVTFVADYGIALDLGLALVAVGSGALAWKRRKGKP